MTATAESCKSQIALIIAANNPLLISIFSPSSRKLILKSDGGDSIYLAVLAGALKTGGVRWSHIVFLRRSQITQQVAYDGHEQICNNHHGRGETMADPELGSADLDIEGRRPEASHSRQGCHEQAMAEEGMTQDRVSVTSKDEDKGLIYSLIKITHLQLLIFISIVFY